MSERTIINIWSGVDVCLEIFKANKVKCLTFLFTYLALVSECMYDVIVAAVQTATPTGRVSIQFVDKFVKS